MALVQPRLALEEFLELPEREPALEYQDGEVTQKVSPKHRHARLQSFFCTQLNQSAEPRKLGLAFTEARTTFAGRSYVPDVVFYGWERLVLGSDGVLADDFLIAPDLAIEIRSPGQSFDAQVRRCRWYVANDVRLALLVDPEREIVRAFRPGLQPAELRGEDVIDLGDVLPGFRMTPRELFASLRPTR